MVFLPHVKRERDLRFVNMRLIRKNLNSLKDMGGLSMMMKLGNTAKHGSEFADFSHPIVKEVCWYCYLHNHNVFTTDIILDYKEENQRL